MVWLTYLTGLGLFALGIYTKRAWFLADWSAYLPVLFGLAYTTFGEGMRSLPKSKRVFLALAILLSLVVPAALYPLVIHLQDVLAGRAAEWESGRLMQPMHVYQATATAAVSLLYLVIALVAWFRQRPPAPETHLKL
jgi:hypothetical protein